MLSITGTIAVGAMKDSNKALVILIIFPLD